MDNKIKEIEEKLLRKEQECERLKDELATYGATGICETCTEKSVLQNDKYIKALREIKEMCSEMNCESLMQNSWCANTDFKMSCCEKLFKKQILQLISEVEL